MNTSGDSAAALTQDDYAITETFCLETCSVDHHQTRRPAQIICVIGGFRTRRRLLDESRTRRVTAPAVLDRFRFLDDDGRSTQERLRRALQVMASNGPDDHGVVLAKIPEGAFRTNLSIAANASEMSAGCYQCDDSRRASLHGRRIVAEVAACGSQAHDSRRPGS